MEFVYDKHCLQRARLSLALVLGAYAVLLLWNLHSGVIFYFDQADNYCRGPLNAAGFLAPMVEIVLLLFCYVRNRRSVGHAMVRLMWAVPPIVLLVLYQAVYHRDTGRFDSAEALIRLSDDQDLPVSPAEFIPVAEENGLIDALSWIVLEASSGCLAAAQSRN